MVLIKIILLNIFALFTQLMCHASVLTNASDSICNQKEEIFLPEKGVESSFILDLHPNSTLHTCRRQFRAPESYSFYVRLQRISSHSATSNYFISQLSSSSRTCRLSISQSLNGEILPPWRIDPCELIENQLEEEPCRLLQGSLNIDWNHHGNTPDFRLVITVIGNGNPHCLDKNKFACLEYDSVPLLCIDKDLTCDGIRHCPINVNGISDEDPIICGEQRTNSEESTIQNMFKKIQIIKSFFTHEVTTTPHPVVKTQVIDIDKQLEIFEKDVNYSVGKRGHRGSLTGLSKYGPWGYLFLGMLLCGGALLVCGLWECCCHSNKPDPVDTLNGDVPTVFLESGPIEANTSSNSSPRYEEIDPPPAYCVLFPNQKSFTALDSEAQSSIDNDERIHSIQTQTD